MGYSAANDRRSLLAAAAGLRQLGANGLPEPDQVVYLMAAEAMERRAQRLAGQLPETEADCADPTLHRPVDMIV